MGAQGNTRKGRLQVQAVYPRIVATSNLITRTVEGEDGGGSTSKEKLQGRKGRISPSPPPPIRNFFSAGRLVEELNLTPNTQREGTDPIPLRSTSSEQRGGEKVGSRGRGNPIP